jgi:hypothetical protein
MISALSGSLLGDWLFLTGVGSPVTLFYTTVGAFLVLPTSYIVLEHRRSRTSAYALLIPTAMFAGLAMLLPFTLTLDMSLEGFSFGFLGSAYAAICAVIWIGVHALWQSFTAVRKKSSHG